MINQLIIKMNPLKHCLEEMMNLYGESAVLSEAKIVKKLRKRESLSKLIKLSIYKHDFASPLLDFLAIKDIAKLDSAITSHELRFTWLHTLSESAYQHENVYYIVEGDEAVHWCVKKKIEFKSIAFKKGSMESTTTTGD